MTKKISFEGVSFDVDWVKSKTLKEFIEHEKHHGLSDAKMKEFYDSLKEKPKAGESVKEK